MNNLGIWLAKRKWEFYSNRRIIQRYERKYKKYLAEAEAALSFLHALYWYHIDIQANYEDLLDKCAWTVYACNFEDHHITLEALRQHPLEYIPNYVKPLKVSIKDCAILVVDVDMVLLHFPDAEKAVRFIKARNLNVEGLGLWFGGTEIGGNNA